LASESNPCGSDCLSARPDPFRIKAFKAAGGGNDILEGYLVLCSGGGTEGFWGPISFDCAVLAAHFACTTPWHTGVHVRQIVRHVQAHHRHAHAGLALLAATALEYAALDWAAKRRQVPVWSLLSAMRPPPCPVYATFFGLELEEDTVSELVQKHGLALSVKKISADRISSLNSLMNSTDTGSCSWAVDFKASYDAENATAILKTLPADLAWVEEPFLPHALDTLRGLALKQRIAAGEHFYSLSEFCAARRLGVSVFQPDPVFAGGLDNYIRIATWLERYGAIYPHGNGLIPALHIAGATKKTPIIEYHFGLEAKRQCLWSHKIAPGPRASVQPPDLPGWHGYMCDTVKFQE
jgi:L-alanine-DL-glutamate epimerase-like enolase superfamily enzyme